MSSDGLADRMKKQYEAPLSRFHAARVQAPIIILRLDGHGFSLPLQPRISAGRPFDPPRIHDAIHEPRHAADLLLGFSSPRATRVVPTYRRHPESPLMSRCSGGTAPTSTPGSFFAVPSVVDERPSTTCLLCGGDALSATQQHHRLFASTLVQRRRDGRQSRAPQLVAMMRERKGRVVFEEAVPKWGRRGGVGVW
ncbi:hypothetical protein F4778DRAFT_783024 [Xylariomycetidae sp. FL2044]|nr:hypothetical protein F4778DRAFT_783024 [Xylariomycetidae sp. FL2044]